RAASDGAKAVLGDLDRVQLPAVAVDVELERDARVVTRAGDALRGDAIDDVDAGSPRFVLGVKRELRCVGPRRRSRARWAVDGQRAVAELYAGRQAAVDDAPDQFWP